jgi:probable rRNA maturation factor
MSRLLAIRNRQQACRLDLPRLRRIARHLLETELGLDHYTLGLHLVDAEAMAAVNAQFLGHPGSTDVITFDQSTYDPPTPLGRTRPPAVCGELFICLEDAIAQARQFRVTWQEELIRYLVHGLLHLRGHDDLEISARRRMKRAENQLVRALSLQFGFSRLGRVCARPSPRPRAKP